MPLELVNFQSAEKVDFDYFGKCSFAGIDFYSTFKEVFLLNMLNLHYLLA